jgi:hypothetical protein
VEEVTRRLPAAKRRALLRCNRAQPECIASLGTAGGTEVVLVTEVVPFLSGYRAGIRVYAARTGASITEHQVPGVREEQLLDALTQSLDVVVPRMRLALRGPPPTAPPPVVTQTPPAVTPSPSAPLSPPEAPGPRHTWRTPAGIAGVAAGMAAIAVTAYFGSKAGSARDDINAAYADGRRPTQDEVRGTLNTRYDDLKRNRTAAFVSGGAALALLGAGAYLWGTDGPPQHPGATSLLAGPGGVGLLVRLP